MMRDRPAMMPANMDYAGADVQWSCTRKKAYPDEATATKVANRMNFEKKAGVQAYGCSHCGRYHIGRKPA